MDTSKSEAPLSEYGLTEEEVALLKARGKDSWYHLKVLERLPIKGFTAKQVVPDKAFSFRNGPKYQLSRVDWRSPIDLHVTGDVAVDAIEPWNEAEIEQSMQISRRMLRKDPTFSVGFMPVISQETKPSMAETPKSPPPESQSQLESPSHGPKLEPPFEYQPNLLKRKPTFCPSSEHEAKRTRINSPDEETMQGKLNQQSTVTLLATPDESRHSSPLFRLQQSKECEQLSTQSKTWLLEMILIKSYNAISWHDTTDERHANVANQMRLRWDNSTKTLSVHNASSGYRLFAAEISEIPVVFYQECSQALFFQQWNDKSKSIPLAAALICLDDADFDELITMLKGFLGPENVRSKERASFWQRNSDELRAAKSNPKMHAQMPASPISNGRSPDTLQPGLKPLATARIT